MQATIKKLIEIIKENQRYGWVFLVLILVFLINRGFPAEKITSESCAGGKCKTLIEDPSLSNEKPAFYMNDFFSSGPNEYYRLIFKVSSNQKTSLDVFATNVLDRDKKIGTIEIDGPITDSIQEILFKSDKNYSDLLFKKAFAADGAGILVNQVNISKLNITNDREMANLAPTIIGGVNMEVEDQAQTKNDHPFEQLKDPKMVLGQIFTPKMDYITGVSLDIDIVKQSNNGGKSYVLELRDVDMDSDAPIIKSNPIATLGFSVNDLEQYRQTDGKFLFPLSAKLEPGKSYFIGINNDKINTDKFNYLILKGTKDGNAYPDGQVAVKFQKQSYLATGSLYFKTYGFELKKYNGASVLPGSVIEDLGKGKTQFSYRSLLSDYELNNLNLKTDDIYFDTDKNAIDGRISDVSDSYFVYKFETVYPFSDFSVKGKQADPMMNKIKMSYSFDNQSWQEIPSSILKDANNQEYQSFNSALELKLSDKKEIFIKVEPQKDKYPDQSRFGLKDFEFKSDLINAKK